MIIRQLKQTQYDRLHHSLMMRADIEPLDASYTVKMTINGAEYALKIQPERHNKMAILQALQIDREDCGPTFQLITNGNLLSALFELLIHQKAK